ncbi:MAG: hypothetical protein JO021_24485 [Alphaproteobacteria bacterium]|nr:hypothetical protein [Alphaproteobacteria bacterium]
MEIRTVEAYRQALTELKGLGGDDPRRRELEAAITAYAQIHDNTRVRRGRPPARNDPRSPKFPGD